MEFRRTERKHMEVSLIPLINVIFLLLVFFMVAGKVEGIDIIEVNPPESVKPDTKFADKATVYLASDGRMAVNNDFVSEKDLKTIISTLFIENPKQKVTIKSDAGVPAGKLVSVMNIIEENGGEDISLITQNSN